MTQSLDEIFGELGISQYLNIFVDQGFDTWDTILDITESDLDALGVKLGHRRKLQRRIANFRGIAPDAALVSPTQASIEDPRLDAQRPEPAVADHRDGTNGVVAKRKYRRHPKPDENAPERPPSAYVLFSNKMREDLKGRNLTFTEIAKLVGENWQNLAPSEKEPFETQAQTAKDKYNQDLTAYKKTSEYRKYMAYLQDFKAKHSPHAQEKDAPKRVKLSDPANIVAGITTNGTTPPRARSATGSGSEPPPTREQRQGSGASTSDTFHSPPPGPYDRSSRMSPPLGGSPREVPSVYPSRQNSGKAKDGSGNSPHRRNLPSLSDVFEGRSLSNGIAAVTETNGYGVGYPRAHVNGSPGPPGLMGGESRPPSLRKEYSSAGSASSTYSFPRTPIEGSLPIHALLSGKPGPPFDGPNSLPHLPGEAISNGTSLAATPPGISSLLNGGPGYFGSQPLAHSYPLVASPQQMTNGVSPQRPLARPDTDSSNLDAISALLRAGEIVDRQQR